MSTVEGTALKPSSQTGRLLAPEACIPSVTNPQGHIFTKKCSLPCLKNRFVYDCSNSFEYRQLFFYFSV